VGLVIYALILSAVVFTGFGQFLSDLFGEDRLVVINDADLKWIEVTYDGRAVKPKPGFGSGFVPEYITFVPMHAVTSTEPVLTIRWETRSGEPGSISRPMPMVDDRLCLFVLRIDASGKVFDFKPPDRFSELERRQRRAPFWWTCHFE
jgi:hypothetical protein